MVEIAIEMSRSSAAFADFMCADKNTIIFNSLWLERRAPH